MVPANQILPKQYTRGGEFAIASTGADYKGFYCVVLGSKFYTGETYTRASQELVKRQSVSEQKLNYLPPQETIVRYFISKEKQIPIVIKEVNKQTYDLYRNNNLYIKVSLLSNTIYSGSPEVEAANKQMPGLKAFLSV